MKLKFWLIPLGIIYSISAITILIDPYVNYIWDWPANFILYLYLPMMFAVWYLITKSFTWKNIQNNFLRTAIFAITALYSLDGVVYIMFIILNKVYYINLEQTSDIFKFVTPLILILGFMIFPVLLSISLWYLLLKENK